ncbi:putative DNA binding protein [Tripterygium wilfordii]|uniref:Putative DNA binding protein n=1 Tax=Tripterygium wilfordii TaxID=458696 RepID=A0A7J7BXD8_TRIWF|nr:glutamic acid-rich protein-like [Tripterygium wilfordii]XP_038692940.1 glutamic acid-rich protein-like [Tripterygium wilfordii]KAF5726570.1 putative DNA binding protein [Tripterygium wilfordii]
MSRCFPFPPPGYEKKITIDDTGLLKEEKHKEKKHKKDKEKRDRDKDRSKEKHKEKKERKEKRKGKDRERDKHQDKISNEKRIGQQGCSSAENLGSKCLQNNGITNNKYMQELARRIVDADTTAGSQMVQKIDPAKKRKAEQLAEPAENNNGNHAKEEGKPKVKIGDGRRVSGFTDHFEASCLENAIGENLFGMDWKRVDEISLSKENQLDGQEKKKNKESGRSDRQKDRHKEQSRMPIDNNWEKENKKEEKAKEVNGQSNGHLTLKEQSVRLKESGKDAIDSSNFKPPSLLKTSSKNSVGEGNVGKRKDLELNRLLPENGSGPNKFPRPISSHSVIENGKKSEPCETAFQPTSEKQGPVHCQRVDVKEHGINSVVKDQGPNACSTRSSSSVLAVHSSGDTSAKPPHPDSKYLSQILAVPKVEWSDFDDQEWLFSSDHLLSKKPKVTCNLVDRTPQVWADALKIDSADVTALPYVIPY